jgi:hypothetical protein
VRRSLSIALLSFATAGSFHGGADTFARFNRVSISPATVSIYIGTISMTFQPFIRHNATYSSTYSARVFPYFFFNEKGRIWIVVPDDALRRIDRGESVDFTGHATSDSGDERRVEGHATPTGRSSGKIRVRVFVTRRIVLTCDTTYELRGSASP